MADLGLGNRKTVRRHLLPANMVNGNSYQDTIDDLAKGVAAAFDKFLNRTLKRGASVQESFPAHQSHYILRRYPIEAVTSVELRTDIDDGWSTEDAILNRDDEAGIIYLGAGRGHPTALLRVTYTGGYWFDSSEDDSGSLPAGATQLPDDLKAAWLFQCRAVWEKLDVGGKQIGAAPNAFSQAATMEISPLVAEMIKGYTRFALM